MRKASRLPGKVKEIVIKKSHNYLSESWKESLPAGWIDKQYTGIGATRYEIEDTRRNSIIVCPTVALASSKARWAKDDVSTRLKISVFYLGSDTDFISFDSLEEIRRAVQAGKRTKILAVVDSFVKHFNGELNDLIPDFHLFIDEADTLQIDSVFRPVMEESLDLYFKFRNDRRTMITATPIGSVLKKIRREPKSVIIKEGYVKPTLKVKKVEGYMAHYVGRAIKEQLYKDRDTKILVAANSFDLIQEIIVAGQIPEENVRILCSEQSRYKAGYLFGKLVSGRLPSEAKVVFMTSAYYMGIDIYEPVITYIVADTKKKNTMLSVEQIYQVCGRARHSCTSRYFLYNSILSDPKTKTVQELKAESIVQYNKLSNKRILDQEEMISTYSLLPSGSFWRVSQGVLKENLLLYDLRLNNYKKRFELYGKNSTPEIALGKYFRVSKTTAKSIAKDSNLAVKYKNIIKEYKIDLFNHTYIFTYGIVPDEDNKPFTDSYMTLASSIRRRLPDVAKPIYDVWIQKHLDEYKISDLKKLNERLEAYTFPVVDDEECEKLLHEFDF